MGRDCDTVLRVTLLALGFETIDDGVLNANTLKLIGHGTTVRCYSWDTKMSMEMGIRRTDCWESQKIQYHQAGLWYMTHQFERVDIFVGAEDRPYDGIDQNCDGLDDFDQDGDGFIPNEYVGVTTIGLVETGQLPGGDCDDEDAIRHPDTEEVGDGVING